MINICIFYPDRRIGGGPYWLLRLANELTKDKAFKVFYIDYSDGFSHYIPEIQNSKNITFIDYTDNCNKLLIEEPCILFAPIHDVFRLPLINPKSKVILHNWHNECIPVLQSSLNFDSVSLSYFLSYIKSCNAQVFNDGSHLLACRDYSGIKFLPSFLPVIVPKKSMLAPCDLINKNEINIAVLGRVVLDKVFAINNVILQACKYKTKKNINIHIIGDGDSIDLIKTTNIPSNIKIKKCGIIRDNMLNIYLCNNVDILFAMGTSVLEGAALGLPSIVIPSEMKPFDFDEFVYLPYTTNYILGFYPKQKDKLELKTVTFAEVLNKIYILKHKHIYGIECLNYVKNKHYAENVASLFKKKISETTLNFFDLYNLVRHQSIQCIVYNKDTYIDSLRTEKHKFLFIRILTIVYSNSNIKFYLFGFIPFLTIIKKKRKKIYRLFFINIYKIRF